MIVKNVVIAPICAVIYMMPNLKTYHALLFEKLEHIYTHLYIYTYNIYTYNIYTINTHLPSRSMWLWACNIYENIGLGCNLH